MSGALSCGCDPDYVGEQGYDQGRYGWICQEHLGLMEKASLLYPEVPYRAIPKGCDGQGFALKHAHLESLHTKEYAGVDALAKHRPYGHQELTLPDGRIVGTVPAPIRQFESGATRNVDTAKFDFEGFLNPEALHAFGEYMHSHRQQKDGSVRDSDNWQKGIPLGTYIKSLVRHTFDLWRVHRGYVAINPDTNQPHTARELCAAITFNAMGYLKELVDPSPINGGK